MKLTAFVFVAALTLAACSGSVGPQGPKGDTGATGATGPQGPKGDTGEQGIAGTPGAVGGGLYTSRNSVYCVDQTVGTNATFAFATCNSSTSIVISGGCLFTNTAYDFSGLSLLESYPRFIAGTGNTAGNQGNWTCSWTGSHNELGDAGATARICCIDVP